MNLNQITIPSRDLVRSAAFYQQLGLSLIVDSIPRYARFECPNGESTFSLHHDTNFEINSGLWIYFEIEDLEEKVKDLKQLGIAFETPIEEQSWLWTEIRLKDPDGHQLILFRAGENRKNPPWKVKS